MKIGEIIQNVNIPQSAGVAPSDRAEGIVPPEKEEVTPAVRKRDEYVPSGEEEEAAGLYSLEYDEEGEPMINFDAPKESSPEKSGEGKPEKPEEKEKSESCTANTDRVDREIKRLKEKQEQLEQQLRSANDEEQAKRIEKQLAAVQSELLQKDNEGYRRSQAVFS